MKLGRPQRRTSSAELRARVAAVPYWWHSIELGSGVVTPGVATPQYLASSLAVQRWPDLAGRTVLDVGAWDGFYAFEAERRGAARVVALDHYVWALRTADVGVEQTAYKKAGGAPRAHHDVSALWDPDGLPGKVGFDLAHDVLQSNVEPIVADFMQMDLEELGPFDVVLFLGVLYHLESPLEALRRLAHVTQRVAVIETAAVVVPGHEDASVFEFYGADELGEDVSNWWAPTIPALRATCGAAGFARTEVMWDSPPSERHRPANGLERLRVVVHAHR